MSRQSASRIAVVWATTRTRPSGCCSAMSCRHVGEPVGGLDRVLAAGQVVGHRVGAERGQRVGEPLGHLGRGQALTGAEVQFAEPFVDRAVGGRLTSAQALRGDAGAAERWTPRPRRGGRFGPRRRAARPARGPRGGERDVAGAGVAVLRVPDGLAVADEDEVGHRVGPFSGVVRGVGPQASRGRPVRSTNRRYGSSNRPARAGPRFDDLADADHLGGDVGGRRGPVRRPARPSRARVRRCPGRVTGRPRMSARSWHQ